MNLENLDLVELNAQEIQETDGGCWNCVPFGNYIAEGLHQAGDFLSGLYDGVSGRK